MALRAFEDRVRAGEFTYAQQGLSDLSAMLDSCWPRLETEQRAVVDEAVMAGLKWARAYVAANREQMRAQLERIEGSKVYQMNVPRKRASLALVG